MLGITSYTPNIIGLFERQAECNSTLFATLCEKAVKVTMPLEFFNREPAGGLNFKELNVAEIMQQDIYPEFVNIGLASQICILDDAELTWREPEEDVIINSIFSSVPTYGMSGRVNFDLAVDDISGRRVNGWALNPNNRADYVCYCNCGPADKPITCRPADITGITFMDISFIKLDDIKKYIEVRANISEDFMPEVVTMVDENFRNETAGIPYDKIPEEARTVYLCEGVYIYISAYKSIDNATELRVSTSVVKKLPNTRHFHWTAYGGLTEIYDKVYRPPLTSSENKYHGVFF